MNHPELRKARRFGAASLVSQGLAIAALPLAFPAAPIVFAAAAVIAFALALAA